jgi:hypothetical protein
MDFIFVYAMQVGELAGIAVGATVLLNILISGYGTFSHELMLLICIWFS